MRQHLGIILLLILLLGAALFVGYRAWTSLRAQNARAEEDGGAAAVAVEVAPVTSGLIRDVRMLSGSLEARAQFSVAPKVGGLLEQIHVDIGDEIERGQVVATIDDAELIQALAQAQAELAVRQAELARAQSERDLAQRDYDRAQALMDRGIASESELDETSASLASATAALALAGARVEQAEASLEIARIRLGYAEVRATWSGGPDTATVAERYQDAGNTIQIGEAIIAVTSLDPLTAVVTVTEADYAQLSIGQPATLTTDAVPDETFSAEVVRIAPVFREASRQARVELEVENPERVLRPGMFIRVRVVLQQQDATTIIPTAAIVGRGGGEIVFTVDRDSNTAKAHPIETGIVEGDRVQIVSPDLAGPVVVLGQHLLEDGSAVTVSETIDDEPAEAGE